uniref:Uncharacterized protein n=1 Tax=Tetraselmis sp. GSL018 TaxID=582737 RepID=A0A061SA73_9CHLO
MELHRLEKLAKKLCKNGQSALRRNSKSTNNYISQFHASVVSYSTLLWQACKAELEDWLYQCRKHLPYQSYLELMKTLEHNIKCSTGRCYIKMVGLCFSILEEANFSEMQTIMTRSGLKGFSATFSAFFVVASMKLYFRYFARPLQDISRCRKHMRCSEPQAVGHMGICTSGLILFRPVTRVVCKLRRVGCTSVQPESETSHELV